MARKPDSLRIAYENEFSNFYDRMPYGSAVSLEHMLNLVPDWHGMVGVGFAYDTGITGLRADHERARAWYHKAEEEGFVRATPETKITLQEFRYARHLDPENYKVNLTDRVLAVYRVLLCIVMTSRGETSGKLGVLYTAGLAYSYRLSHIVSAIPYEKNPELQTEEDRQIASAVEPMNEIMGLYSRQNADAFRDIVEKAGESGRLAGSSQADSLQANAYKDGFLTMLLGIMLFDTYRCPIDRDSLIRTIGTDYRKKGISLLWLSFQRGCTAAGIYLYDLLAYSGIGKITVPEVLKLQGSDLQEAFRGKAFDATNIGATIMEGEAREKRVRRAFRRHMSGEDRTGNYLSLY